MRDVVEGKVDRRQAALEDRDGEEVDELGEVLNRVAVATEIRSDDERLLGLEKTGANSCDGYE